MPIYAGNKGACAVFLRGKSGEPNLVVASLHLHAGPKSMTTENIDERGDLDATDERSFYEKRASQFQIIKKRIDETIGEIEAEAYSPLAGYADWRSVPSAAAAEISFSNENPMASGTI